VLKSRCNFRTEKSAGKKSASRGRSRQRKTKKAKSSSEEEEDDEEGTYIFIFKSSYYVFMLVDVVGSE